MKIVAVLLFTLIFFCCNPKQKDKKITTEIHQSDVEKVSFYQMEMHVKDPQLLPSQKTFFVLKGEKIYLIVEKYEGGELLNADTLKAISNTDKNKKIIAGISRKDLEKNQVFGTINLADEGAIGITFYLKNGKQFVWKISYFKETLPKEVQPVYEIYENIVKELYEK